MRTNHSQDHRDDDFRIFGPTILTVHKQGLILQSIALPVAVEFAWLAISSTGHSVVQNPGLGYSYLPSASTYFW